MIEENDIEKACEWLRDHAEEGAVFRAQRIYVEEWRKVIKAQIMKEHVDLPVSAQEREAYADERYTQHLSAIQEAVKNDEYHRFLRAAAEAKIEAWRTQQADTRGMGRVG